MTSFQKWNIGHTYTTTIKRSSSPMRMSPRTSNKWLQWFSWDIYLLSKHFRYTISESDGMRSNTCHGSITNKYEKCILYANGQTWSPTFKAMMSDVHSDFITQSFPCNSRVHDPLFKRYFKSLPKCFTCLGRQSGGCRFKGNLKLFKGRFSHIWPIGCRTVDADTATVSFRYTTKEVPQFRQVFNRPITSEDINLKLVCHNDSLCLNQHW